MRQSEEQRAGEPTALEYGWGTGLAETLDPGAFGQAFAQAWQQAGRNPLRAVVAGARYATGFYQAFWGSLARACGLRTEAPVTPGSRDWRWSDSAWEQDPWFFMLAQNYLLARGFMQDIVEGASVDELTAQKASFAAEMLLDALSPTNFVATNPAALRKAFQTGGASLMRGLANFLQDLARNEGIPRQVDTSGFKLGKNLAATPGKVVFRNRLMELIQYEAQTESVFETPLLCSPPWINKYYIMDLAPGRSFIEWAAGQGHTVFAISYRNPDGSMQDVTLEDYLVHGPLKALDVIESITGSPQSSLVGLCLGGTLATMLLAHLRARGLNRVRSLTLLNTLVDFGDPGMLAMFTDRAAIERLERKMAKHGFLDAADMARTFSLLRAQDLVWSYVVRSWLLGEDPPAFDILAWNDDGTRMPAAMHSSYLRSCYLENRLARGELELAGTRLRLEEITEADAYILAAEKDHITPWTSSYRTTQLLNCRARFVLTSSGHVAGVVNPIGSGSRYWLNDETPPEATAWRAEARESAGSWWEDWANWIGSRSGRLRPPPPMGSAEYPPIGDAPGTYVHER